MQTNARKKRGRYNSKYALSERLYCGECGSPYKRVTWNIHGRKEIVWRCVNRVTYGTKFCHNSPSVQEEALHQTLLRAIQNLTDNYTEEVAMQINGILHDLQGGTTELEKLQQKLADCAAGI
ncbi:zinc ribbon domain-containing protein [Gemmiger formicilis]|uniref:zinc ribbon domain-containing protein n=1 Tax=Gemmiger formicilis TaxID=745368 RepID=UPI003520504A